MATLEELLTEDRTRMPKERSFEEVLAELMAAKGRAPAQEPSRSPAIETPKVSTSFQRDIPEVSEAVQRLESEISKKKSKWESMQPDVAAEKKAMLEQAGVGAGRKGGLFSPTDLSQTQAAIKAQESLLGEYLKQRAPQKEDRNLLAEALLAFAPALAGYGLGRAAGGVGMAETGIAAGAQAGLAGLERMEKKREADKTRQATREAEAFKLRSELAKMNIEATKEAELLSAKSLNTLALAVEKGAAENIGRELQKALIKTAVTPGPKQQQAEAIFEELKTLETKKAAALGETGKKTIGRKTEIEGGKTLGEFGFGFSADPKNPPNEKSSVKAREILSDWGGAVTGLNNLLQTTKSGVVSAAGGFTNLGEDVKRRLALTAGTLKNDILKLGATLTPEELRLANALLPMQLSGMDLAKSLFDQKDLYRRVLELREDLQAKIQGKLKPYGVVYTGEAAGKPAGSAAMEKPVRSSADIRKELEELRKGKK